MVKWIAILMIAGVITPASARYDTREPYMVVKELPDSITGEWCGTLDYLHRCDCDEPRMVVIGKRSYDVDGHCEIRQITVDRDGRYRFDADCIGEGHKQVMSNEMYTEWHNESVLKWDEKENTYARYRKHLHHDNTPVASCQ